MNKFFKIFKLLFLLLFLYSCGSVGEALQGKKRSEQGDEFLVQKKNPLAMPPDYEKIPKPGNQEVSPKTFSDNNDVKDLLNIEESDSTSKVDDDSSENIESAIIEKIQ